MELMRTHRCGACGESGHNRITCPVQRRAAPPLDERIAEIATLREDRDAITADIADHERVRGVIDERLHEAYERRAQIDALIRQLRGAL